MQGSTLFLERVFHSYLENSIPHFSNLIVDSYL